MNEYQKFAASKAQKFLHAMGEIGETNQEIFKLKKAMQPDVEKIMQGLEPLPTRVLSGWSIYFSPEVYNGVYENYPTLVDANAELSWILRHASMESYKKSRQDFGA